MLRLRKRYVLVAAVVLALGGIAAVAYARLPEVRLARHLDRGETYFARRQYREAALEYRNVLAIVPDHPRATRQLGLAHYHLAELGNALRYLPAAQRRDPDDSQVRLTLARIYLLGRRPEEARRGALDVLERDPRNLDALVIVAGAARSAEERAAAVQRLEAHRADFGGRARFHLALADLYRRGRDLGRTGAALRDAVAAEPGSVEAYAALGDFYVSKREPKEAERAYRRAAELSPVNSLPRLGLADFFLLVGRVEEAKGVLREITDKAPEFLPAWRRLAEIAFLERRYDESLKALDVVFARNPSDFGGLLLRGRVRLAQRRPATAVEDFQSVLKLEPRFAPGHHQLAQAYLATGNVQYARAELREATTLQPTFTEAILQLAELDIRARAFAPAVEAVRKLIARLPEDPRGWRVLASAYMASGDAARALEASRRAAQLTPKDPRGPLLVGLALRALGRPAEARAAFEASLELAPGFADPLAQLVAMAAADDKLDVALERVTRELRKAPSSSRLQAILGAVHAQRRDLPTSEAAYRRALELEPGLMAAHVALAQVLVAAGRPDDALAALARARAVDPNNVGVLMLIATVHERRGDIARAREAYEQLLAINPRFAPAANSLAWIYSEHGGDKEKALQLARTAKQLTPADPRVSDTLGWILYKRGVYHQARALLQESVAQLPDNIEVQYHFGMAAWKAGARQQAVAALQKAVASPTPFAGKDEASRVLSGLR